MIAPPTAQDALLFIILAGGLWLAWRREQARARRGESELSAPVRALFLVAACGGAFGALVWFTLRPDTFPWLLPPLASRLLAAASAAFSLASALALSRGRRAEARLMLAVTLGYFLPLLVALPLHLDRFDFGRPVTWGFFLTGAGMSVVAGWAMLVDPSGRGPLDAEESPARWTVATTSAVGLLALALGLLLFVAPGVAGLIWPWRWTFGDQVDALTTRLVAVMFLGVAAGAAEALRQHRQGAIQAFMALLAPYGVLAVVGIALFLQEKPATPAMLVYLALLGLLALLALLGLRRPDARASG